MPVADPIEARLADLARLEVTRPDRPYSAGGMPYVIQPAGDDDWPLVFSSWFRQLAETRPFNRRFLNHYKHAVMEPLARWLVSRATRSLNLTQHPFLAIQHPPYSSCGVYFNGGP